MTKCMKLRMDGHDVDVEAGDTLLDAARKLGIDIPTLCYHPELKPYGGCRLCLVEIHRNGKSKLVASCAYPVEADLEVLTESPKVIRIRKLLVEMILAVVPETEKIQKLAKRYDVHKGRMPSNTNMCCLCGLCVRYCDEVKGKHAVDFVGRGTGREIAWIPNSSFEEHCWGCLECMSFCPTGVFPSNIGLVDSMLSHSR